MSTTTLARTGEVFESVGQWSSDRAPAANAMYAGEGQSLAAFRNRGAANPRYNQMFLEALSLYENVLTGSRRAALAFSEAMSTSDFPLLFGDVIERQMLGFYRVQSVNWELTARRSRVRDFRSVKRFTVDGAQGVLDQVGQLSEYKAASLSEGSYTYSVGKYGRRVPISWETLINDDLDAFADMPSRLALAARRTEERFATALYVGSTGPNSTFFSAGNANLVTANPALSITGVQTALTIMNNKVDADGAPIYVGEYVLEVPPSLEVVANNILNAVQIWAASGGGTGDGQNALQVNNWLSGRLRLKVNPWLPLIDATANKNTTWYIWASPTEGRPAKEVGFLVGHEQPEMFMKSPNATRVGGGSVDPMAGDFDSDSIEWKIRHVLGGTLMDPKMAVVSNGSGS